MPFLFLVLLVLSCGGGRPALTVKAFPVMAMAPHLFVFQAYLKDEGAEEDIYCLSTEWAWGDDTISARASDCAPYRPGLPVTRVFVGEHPYRIPGDYEVTLSLSKRGRLIVRGSTTIHVIGVHGSRGR
jgi:hypothetical protein